VLFADSRLDRVIGGPDPERRASSWTGAPYHDGTPCTRYEGTVNRCSATHHGALRRPGRHEDHAVRACYAALAMQAAMRTMLRRSAAPTAWRCRYASGSTPATSWCGRFGNDLHMDYSAVGQTAPGARDGQLATQAVSG